MLVAGHELELATFGHTHDASMSECLIVLKTRELFEHYGWLLTHSKFLELANFL